MIGNVVTALFFCFVFLQFFLPIELEDVWWHLATGRWILEHHQIPTIDIFSFQEPAKPWLCYHWLSSSILAWINSLFGLMGLKLARACYFVVLFGIVFYYGRKYLSRELLIFFLGLLTLALSQRFFLKPDMFNFLFTIIFAWRLIAFCHQEDLKRIVWLPLLGIIWFNLHLGAFLYGSMLILSFMVGMFIEGRNKAGWDLLKIFVLFQAGGLINPNGWQGFVYPYQTFLSSHSSGFYNVRHVVMDLLPADYLLQSPKFFYFHLLIVLSALALFFIKKHRISFVLWWVIALAAFLLVRRNSAFFAITSIFIIFEALKQQGRVIDFPRGVKVFCGVLLGVLLLAGIYVRINKSYVYQGKIIQEWKMTSNPQHQELIDFLNNYHLEGRVFNSQHISGPLIYKGYPQLKTFVDGRFVLGNEALLVNQAVFDNPAYWWPKALEAYHFNIVLIDISQDGGLKFINYLKADPLWRLVKINGSWVIYVKLGEFALMHEDLITYEHQLQSITTSEGDFNFLKQLLKEASTKPKHYPEDLETLNTSATLMNLGYKPAGIKFLIEALKISPSPKAIWCARRFLESLNLK